MSENELRPCFSCHRDDMVGWEAKAVPDIGGSVYYVGCDRCSIYFLKRDKVEGIASWNALAPKTTRRSASFCENCNCSRCSAKAEADSIQAALSGDANARCWSCSCGWVGCYTEEEITRFGEPTECQRHYHESLVECDRPHLLQPDG